MGREIATEQVKAKLNDGRTVIIANPGEEIPEIEGLGYVEGGEVPAANVISSQTVTPPASGDGDDGQGASTESTKPAKFEGNKDALIEKLTEMEVDFDPKAKRPELDEVYAKAIAERDAEEQSLGEAPNDKSLGPDSAENK